MYHVTVVGRGGFTLTFEDEYLAVIYAATFARVHGYEHVILH